MQTFTITLEQLKAIKYGLKLAEYYVSSQELNDVIYQPDIDTLEEALLAFDNIIDNQEVTQ